MCICTHMSIYTQIPIVLWIMLHCLQQSEETGGWEDVGCVGFSKTPDFYEVYRRSFRPGQLLSERLQRPVEGVFSSWSPFLPA